MNDSNTIQNENISKKGMATQKPILTYNGKPVPKWLQTPVFEQPSRKKEENIPDWLTKPADL